ncbi:MAG: 2-hydroxychromene-2-carboxylate isomerase [Proteobacteria bacterium]|nr:2-hydroxychromene-2-carboxylate isomerase [Pseudomonadota bacterium]HQR03041.1 2-hydroxychromene-2-carboxylate isomerase [Rhodocyclaceae bacterium]
MKSSAPTIEFWFDFSSTYSYLSIMRIEEMALARGISMVWRPFLLGPIFQSFGWTTSPFLNQPIKGRYMWHDLERRSAKYGLPFRQPDIFPQTSTLPARIALLAAELPWIGTYCRHVTTQNFAAGLDISNEENVVAALDGLVAKPGLFITAALSDANKSLLRTQTEEALRRGIFGAPSFTVGKELFWGDDRLEDALDFCVNERKSHE